MKWRWLLLGISAMVAIAGCGVGAEQTPRALDPGAAPFRAVTDGPTPAPTGSARATLYFTRNGHLVAAARRVPAPVTPAAVLQALVAGPTTREGNAGLSTSVPTGPRLAARSPGSPGVLVVDLPMADSASGSRNDEVLGYAQIVVTLTHVSGVTGVQFSRQGRNLPVPGADGQLSSGPLTARDYSGLV
ncbi:MAG TPA: GerMN domain-containing protein [Mycobacteriales bacterium]|nr:GerMN domain-containing protein [Mycobacteriales bacterium]